MILAALPDLTVTDRLSGERCFARPKKGNAYFE
jgi:hypothetical protein